MAASTEINVSLAAFLRVSGLESAEVNAALLWTRFADPVVHRVAPAIAEKWRFPRWKTIRESFELYESGAARAALTKEQVKVLTDREDTILNDVDVKARVHNSLTAAQLAKPKTNYQVAGALLHRVLTEQPHLRSVANVGARIDIVSSTLAKLHPQVQFTSVDFARNLPKINQALPQSPNWRCQPGYALDLFQRGVVATDVVLFSATSVLFSGPEFHAYCETLAKFAKTVVINERWYPAARKMAFWKIVRPEDLPIDRSINAGLYGNFQHNYVGILEKHGFDIAESRIVDGENNKAPCYLLQIVANNRNLKASNSH